MVMGCGTHLVLQVPGLQVIQKHRLESKQVHELGPVLGRKGAKHMASSQGLPAEQGQMPSHRAGLTWGIREARSARDTATSTPPKQRPLETTQPGDFRVLADEQQELLDVDEHSAAGEAAEQEDDDGTLQDHPHAQQVPAAISLRARARHELCSWEGLGVSSGL